MFWCLVRLSTGALCGGLYANPLEVAIQSAVACSEVKDDGLLVSCQLMERVQSLSKTERNKTQSTRLDNKMNSMKIARNCFSICPHSMLTVV